MHGGQRYGGSQVSLAGSNVGQLSAGRFAPAGAVQYAPMPLSGVFGSVGARSAIPQNFHDNCASVFNTAEEHLFEEVRSCANRREAMLRPRCHMRSACGTGPTAAGTSTSTWS